MSHLGTWVASLSLLLAACGTTRTAQETPTNKCNAVVNTAPTITWDNAPPGTPVTPGPAGGTIVSGTYHLTSAVFYPGSPVTPDCKETTGQTSVSYLVTATSPTTGTFETAGGIVGTPGTVSSTYTTSGTSMSVAVTCPEASKDVSPYTATPTEIRIYPGLGNRAFCGSRVTVLTKQ